MSLEDWVQNGWLERRESSPQEIKDLLMVADRWLSDYGSAGKLSADARLTLAYGAILAAGTVALRAAGYRVTRGGNEHYHTIEALEFAVDPDKKSIPTIHAMRKKRNQTSYEVSGRVSDREAESAGRLAHKLRRDVGKWIRTTYSKLL